MPRKIIGRIKGKSLYDRLARKNFSEELKPRTLKEYGNSLQQMKRQLKEEGQPLTPENLVSLLVQKSKDGKVSKNTLGLRKAAALHYIAEQAQSKFGAGESIEHESHCYEAIQNIGVSHLPRAGESERTSSNRLKFFPKDMVDDLIKWEKSNRKASEPAGLLIAFLRANLQVGLRPQEWFDVYFDTDIENAAVTMTVRNAKHSHGRANGPTRTIILREITADDLAYLVHFYKLAGNFKNKKPDATPDDFYQPLARSLHHAIRKLRPNLEKYPTLYSTRHQVVANAKWSGLSDREIAAMFGHSAIETAKRHYGKRHNAWGHVTFRPSADSLERVNEPTATNTRATTPATPTPDTVRAADELIQITRFPDI